jgi:hypothetical protein
MGCGFYHLKKYLTRLNIETETGVGRLLFILCLVVEREFSRIAKSWGSGAIPPLFTPHQADASPP